nr:MAG TPA: hypothetical protein [Caudoviricetes sp.]
MNNKELSLKQQKERNYEENIFVTAHGRQI